jgi:TRAP transporter TAXI family solute receptor
MKRPVYVSLALLITLVFTAYSPLVQAQTRFASIGTSGAGGTYEIMGTAMAKVIMQHQPTIKVSVEATPGGGIGNIRLLGKESITFGIAISDSGFSAYRGEGIFAKDKSENIRTVLTGLELQCHIIVLSNSGIKSVGDLKGKTIVANSSANTLVYVPQTLEAYGLKAGDCKISNMSTNECVEALKDGHVQAIFTFAIAPASAFKDLALSRDVRFLSVADDKISFMTKKYPYYKKVTIPADYYPKQKQDVVVPAVTSMLYTHSKVDERLVYDVVKALLENSAELAEVHPAAGAFNLERQKELLKGSVIPPFHPGVTRYYKERGILK